MGNTRIIKVSSIDELPDVECLITDEQFEKGMKEGFAQSCYEFPELVKDSDKRKQLEEVIARTKDRLRLDSNGQYDFNSSYGKKVQSIVVKILGNII